MSSVSGKMCYLTGWGRLGRGKSIAYILQQARLPIVDYESCKNSKLGNVLAIL